MIYLHLTRYYNDVFKDDTVIVYSNGIYNLFLPMFNRRVFFFRCTGAIFKIAKKHNNINLQSADHSATFNIYDIL